MSVPRHGGPAKRRPGPAVICIIFFLFGAVWTLVAGILLPSMVGWKDWAFLLVASGLLYLLIRHYTGGLSGSEERYRTVVESAGSIILAMDREGKITFFNRRAEEFFGFPREEIIGENALGTIVPATESSGRDLDQMLQDLLSSPGRFQVNRNENVTSAGKRVRVAWTNRALCDDAGFPVGVVSVGTEIPD